MPSVYYAVCPGTGGTNDKKTGSPTITISSGVATLSVAQTGNIGQGFRITYDTSKVCFISKVNSSTSFDVVTATGGTPSAEASAVTVNSIAADYASLSAAEAGASDATHLNTSNLTTGSHILNLVCYAGASADTTAVSIDGWTTSADYYFNIYSPNAGTQSISINRHQGVWSTSYYIIDGGTSGGATLEVYTTNIRFTGLQITKGVQTYRRGFLLRGTGTLDIRIDSCIIKGPGGDGSTDQVGIGLATTDPTGGTIMVSNCVIYDWRGSSSTAGIEAKEASGVTVTVYNTTVFGCYSGVRRTACTINVVNSAIFNNTDDFNGTIAVTYTASDDNDISGTGNVDLADSAASWNAQFADYDATNPDVSLIANSALIGAGISHSSDSNVPEVDIAGTTRSSWDIGAFEYVASGSISGTCDESFTFLGALTKTAVFGATALESVLLTDPSEKIATFFSSADVNATISAITAALKSINATASEQTSITTNASNLKEVATIMETFITLQDILNKTATTQGTLETSVQISTSGTATAALIAAILQTLILTGVAETEATSLIVSVCDETFTLGNVSIADATKIATLIASFSTATAAQAISELNATLQTTVSLASDTSYSNIITGILEQFLSYTVNSVATGEMLSNAQDTITITTLINNISTLLTVITDNIVFSDTSNWAGIITTVLSEYIDITTATEVARLIASISTQNITVNAETSTNVTFNIALADNIAISDAMLLVKTVASVCADMFNIDNVSFWMEATGKVTIGFTLAKSNITFTLTKGNISINLI